MPFWSENRWLHRVGQFLPVAAAIVVAPLALTSWIEAPPAPPLEEMSTASTAATAAPAAASVEPPAAAPDRIRILRSGDTLGKALRDLGFANEEAERAAVAASRYVNPRQLRPGMAIAAFLSGPQPTRFELALPGQGELAVELGGSEWLPAWRPYRRELKTRAIHGQLVNTLEGSVAAAGANSELAYAMADVLQWDLDFNRDLQPGDRFDVLFEEMHVDGRYFGVERVVAISYAQAGRAFEAFRFGPSGAYYDAAGRPSEKMFLRAPLPYSRVTSGFSSRRFHPVLKVARPHYGVDYGAPVGTPVRVTASGTVVHAGWDGGGGKTVKVRHTNGYLTGYLHLSRFAPGMRPGVRVSQGDVIGYVGATGLATGPHLDYRVQRDGTWIDPQSLKNVPAPPLDPVQLAEFSRWREALRPILAGTSEPASMRSPSIVEAALSHPATERPGTSPASQDSLVTKR